MYGGHHLRHLARGEAAESGHVEANEGPASGQHGDTWELPERALGRGARAEKALHGAPGAGVDDRARACGVSD